MAAIVVAGLFGTLIGSFLNVVVYRVPRGLSVVAPPSACGSCHHQIRPYDNIPLVSWLVLRGRCRDCQAPISARYPLVELTGGVVFTIVTWRFGAEIFAAPSGTAAAAAALALVAFLYLAAISIALALIDLDVQRLPDVIVLPSYAVGVFLLGASALLSGDLGALATAGIGMVGAFVLYLVLALARPGGMGMGDVKLAGVIGLYLGWLGLPELIVGVAAAFLLGGLAGIVLLAVRRRAGTTMPFGPWMLLGAWVGAFAGPALADSYLKLTGIT
jgi:leader peptidase (prepilin peptidase)/N-methyltransferase